MLGISVIILFKSLLHVFCSLVFSAHNSSGLAFDIFYFNLGKSGQTSIMHISYSMWRTTLWMKQLRIPTEVNRWEEKDEDFWQKDELLVILLQMIKLEWIQHPHWESKRGQLRSHFNSDPKWYQLLFSDQFFCCYCWKLMSTAQCSGAT